MSAERPRPQGSDEQVVRDAVRVSYHLLLLVDGGRHPGGDLPPARNGLAGVRPGCVAIYTGISMGPVELAVQPLMEEPPPPDLSRWDDVVEVSVVVERDLRAASLMDDVPAALPAVVRDSGPHRLRIHASGRDTDADGTGPPGLPVEAYLVQSWPEAAVRQESVLRLTSRCGRELRNAAEARRAEPAQVPADTAGRSPAQEDAIADILRSQSSRRPHP